MMIAEHIDDHGELRRTHLDITAEGAVLTSDDHPKLVLPVRAVLLAMRKFGRALAPDLASSEGADASERLELGEGITLRLLRFRAVVDVEPKTYLVLEGDAGEPQCVLASAIAAALRFIGEKSR